MLVVFSFAKGGEQQVHHSMALARLLFVWLALDGKQHTGILTIKSLIIIMTEKQIERSEIILGFHKVMTTRADNFNIIWVQGT